MSYTKDVTADAGWTFYTPTWTAATTNPTLGNGTISGHYKQIGKTVWLHIVVSVGSTTTLGSGNWQFSLPVTSSNNDGSVTAGMAEARQQSSGNNFLGHARVSTGAAGKCDLINATGTAALWDSATPFAWANSDRLVFSLFYETA